MQKNVGLGSRFFFCVGRRGLNAVSGNAVAFGLWTPDVLWLTPRLRDDEGERITPRFRDDEGVFLLSSSGQAELVTGDLLEVMVLNAG